MYTFLEIFFLTLFMSMVHIFTGITCMMRLIIRNRYRGRPIHSRQDTEFIDDNGIPVPILGEATSLKSANSGRSGRLTKTLKKYFFLIFKKRHKTKDFVGETLKTISTT
ncbi:unnamed protein product [Gongylonema pulchrum]|uniref:Uncharacterized protein n=1 Tax=Gongylonema pulchrum TaxID=637853 RepID=A0A3P6QBR0_9BILA|nr:unnamed protein product [Gongylonema pulchrum]